MRDDAGLIGVLIVRKYSPAPAETGIEIIAPEAVYLSEALKRLWGHATIESNIVCLGIKTASSRHSSLCSTRNCIGMCADISTHAGSRSRCDRLLWMQSKRVTVDFRGTSPYTHHRLQPLKGIGSWMDRVNAPRQET